MESSPLTRSDRGKKLAESTDLPSIKSSTKEKTANNLKQSSKDVNENKKTEKQDPGVRGSKRKRHDAYKALFKPQRIRYESDVDEELKDQNSIRIQGAPEKDHNASFEGRVIDLDQIENDDCPQTKTLDGKSIENGGDVSQSNGNIANSDNHMSRTSLYRIEHDLENQQELDTCRKGKETCKGTGIMDNAENNDASSNKPNSEFLEFWVPVQISNVQLEQYCATLLSNAMVLRSNSKSDTLGTLSDILTTNRKCCNHPYTVDPKVQQSLMKDKDPSMVVNVGAEASGKLQFLDHVLPEIQKRQLKVLILFQHTIGALSGSLSLGHILVDFVHRRFGQNSYEHVDGAGKISSKKQAAINMFNKDMTKFILLLESRACHQSIKLSSVDAIIIFDSELNPFNDVKSLQKLSIDSQSENIMIFRLYSASTLEEKILKLAENNMALDIRSHSLRSNYDALLTWGASDLFDKLTEFHSQTVVNISSEESFLKDVVEEFLYTLSHKCKSNDTRSKSIITRAQNCGIYGKNTMFHVEVKTHLPDGDQSYIFWRKLLEGRFPDWKFIIESTPRQRKRPNYFSDKSPQRQGGVDGDGVKIRKMTVNISTIELAQLRTVTEGETGVNEGVAAANDESQPSSGDRFWSTAVNNETSLLNFLKPTVSKLCNILNFSEDVKLVVETFLEFVLDNFKVSKEHTTILQAFMISVCWIGSSLAKNKIDRSESFALAKKHCGFSCNEEHAESVYKKLKQVKETFLERTQVRPAIKDLAPAPEGVKQGIDSSQHITNIDASNENVSRKGVEEVEKINGERDENPMVAPTLPENPIEEQSHDEPVCEGDNDIESTGSHTSEQIGEVSAQQLDAPHAREDLVEKLKRLEREFANKLENHKKFWENCLDELKVTMLAGVGQVAAENELSSYVSQPEVESADMGTSAGTYDEEDIEDGEIYPDTSDVGDDHNQTESVSKEDAEDSIIQPDALHANEDQYDSCGSDSVIPTCEAISQDKTPSVQPISSPASDHEIQNEPASPSSTDPMVAEPTYVAPEQPVNALYMYDKLTNSVSPQRQNETNPLEAEVEWLHTEKDNAMKFHEETKQRLNTECEKEIAEIVAQISLKYEAKHLEAEAAYNSEKMELETNINTVIMSRVLAEAFRCKCQNLTPSGNPSMEKSK